MRRPPLMRTVDQPPPNNSPKWSTSLLLTAVCLICYWNSLYCGFVFDDVSAVRDNRDVKGVTPVLDVFRNDFWGTPMAREQSHKSYRPVTVLTFRANHAAGGMEPWGFHLVNLMLHCLVCVLYHRLCCHFVPAPSALAASLLFAVHPVHSEAVTGVVGRAELISSVFFILAVLSYKRAAIASLSFTESSKSLFLSMICVALAMLSKEQGITVLGICAALEIVCVQNVDLLQTLTHLPSPFDKGRNHNNNHHHSPKRSSPQPPFTRRGAKQSQMEWGLLSRSLALVLTGAGLLLLRFYVMGSTLPVFTNFDNPASYSDYPAKQLTWSYLIAVNAWLLLSPMDLCCDWTMGTIPLVKDLSDPRNVFTLTTFLGLMLFVIKGLTSDHRRDRQVITMGLALTVLPFLPASNLFFPVGFVVAERVLYLPSMGFCLMVAHGFTLLHRQCSRKSETFKKVLQSAFVILLISHGARTLLRNRDWRDESSIFLSGLKVNSGNAKLFNNVGHALEAKGDFPNALNYFMAAASVQPDDVGAHINVGRTYNNLKQYGKAEEAYLLAKSLLPQSRPGQRYTARVAPQHLSVFLNLANLVSRDGNRLEEADALYRQAISMRSDYIQAYINRGDVLLRLNRSDEAQLTYEQALAIDPRNPDLYYNLGVVHIERGRPQQALAHFDRALEIDPDHVQALTNSAILMQESGSAELRPTAYKRLLRADVLTPDSDRVHFNLGMLAMDDGDHEQAEKWFRRAVELKPDFRSGLFNLALLLNERGRPLEAIPHLRSLLRYHGDHVKGLVLLGDIYTNHVRDFDEAERCYRKIVQADPTHVQARHNLCVVMVEKGELEEARKCLEQVREMAPELDYVAKHLAIVEGRISKQQQQQDQQQQDQQQVEDQQQQTPS